MFKNIMTALVLAAFTVTSVQAKPNHVSVESKPLVGKSVRWADEEAVTSRAWPGRVWQKATYDYTLRGTHAMTPQCVIFMTCAICIVAGIFIIALRTGPGVKHPNSAPLNGTLSHP